MRVRLALRFEPAVSRSVWTAESPDVPGFYAARESLDELLPVVETAVREILGEHGWPGEIAFEYEHLRDDPAVPAVPPT
jgi:hypothetical protein